MDWTSRVWAEWSKAKLGQSETGEEDSLGRTQGRVGTGRGGAALGTVPVTVIARSDTKG